MKFGLKNSDIEYIKSVLLKFPEIEQSIVFGSRAIGNFKPSSDVDLCLIGDKVSFDTLSQVKSLLEEEGPLPYQFDVVAYSMIDNEELKKHILKFGIAV